MSDTEKRLTDFIDFKNGKAVQLVPDGEVRVFGSNGVIGCSKEALGESAVIVGRVGAYCGAVHLSEGPFWATDNTIVARPRNGHNLRYIYYLLKKTPLREYAGGAAQPLITQQILSGVRANLHTPTQSEIIAEILSAYDDQIVNNRRRIALVEEAARMLYREWFVHFRFPGHEHFQIIDGLPEGWERKTLGSVLNLQRGFDLPLGDRTPGGIAVYGSTGIVGEHNVAKVSFPTLITGRSGSLGTVCFADDPCWPLNTSLWVTEFKAVSVYFAYFLLAEMNLAKFNGGASVPTLDRKVAHAANVVIPPPLLASLFDEQAKVLFSQSKILAQQNQKLAQARDLLLPRLMNGEIPV